MTLVSSWISFRQQFQYAGTDCAVGHQNHHCCHFTDHAGHSGRRSPTIPGACGIDKCTRRWNERKVYMYWQLFQNVCGTPPEIKLLRRYIVTWYIWSSELCAKTTRIMDCAIDVAEHWPFHLTHPILLNVADYRGVEDDGLVVLLDIFRHDGGTTKVLASPITWRAAAANYTMKCSGYQYQEMMKWNANFRTATQFESFGTKYKFILDQQRMHFIHWNSLENAIRTLAACLFMLQYIPRNMHTVFALLWLYIDWFSHIHQAYFTGTVSI